MRMAIVSSPATANNEMAAFILRGSTRVKGPGQKIEARFSARASKTA